MYEFLWCTVNISNDIVIVENGRGVSSFIRGEHVTFKKCFFKIIVCLEERDTIARAHIRQEGLFVLKFPRQRSK